MTTLPLSNIRVLDLSRVFAMPYAGAYMADLGAEVIKVDSCQAQFMDTTRTLNGPYPGNDPGENYWDRAGTFQTLNRGKHSVTLDLRSDAALEILKQLVSVSDIVLENFTPRVMRRFGLDYANLKAVKPDLIMVSNTGYGHGGPWTNFGAMATALEPTHGTGAFMGYLDAGTDTSAYEGGFGGSVPNKIGNSYSDFLASWTAQMAVMACLIHRARTGQGMWIDLAMYQVGISFLGEGLLDYAFNGRSTRRLGNRHQSMSPHGCYPCLGDDQWVALAVRDDVEWQAFCRALGQPDMAADPRFSQPLQRWRNQDALDANISRWTETRTSYQVMQTLQAGGVPAGPVLNARQLLTDTHWRERGYFETVEHPPATRLGRREYVSRGWHLSGADVHIRSGAPQLGDSNGFVLQGLLGLDGDEIQGLEDDGVIGSQPIGGSPAGAVPLRRQAELGWIVDFDAGSGGEPPAR
ncbi:MAG: hypothetical protein BZY88_11495 [SAR202 cluster bacterium Io17-Chloro-G9]|nr:MAG: hypothetical protein BZY88_11495 [SAR202 cluster bacterium Io17-Chloro-G9]